MLTLVALLVAPASAADIIIPADRDSTVGQHAVQRGWSGYDYVLLGRRVNTSGQERRAILDFDLSGVPLSSDITAAELTVNVETLFGNPVDFTVHAVTSSWVEGTEVPGNDTGTTPNGVSWGRSSPGNTWTNGGEFDATVIGSGTISGTGVASFSIDPSVITDMRDDPAGTHGLLLKHVGAAASDLVRFDSREGAGAATLDLTLDGPVDNLDAVVATLADDINAVKPGFIDEMSSNARARPSVIVDSLREAVSGLIEDGCMTSAASASISSHSSGLYVGSSMTGTHDTDGEMGAATASLTLSPKSFSGTFEDAGGVGVDHTFGDTDSGFRDLRLAADYDTDGFVFGLAIRDKGSKGAFMAIHTQCDGMGSHTEALNSWVGETIF